MSPSVPLTTPRTLFAAAFVLTACCAPPRARAQTPAAAHRLTVLTIHSGAENFPTNPTTFAGIREALAARPELRIDVFSEYLEEDLFPDAQAMLALGDYVRRKYLGRPIVFGTNQRSIAAVAAQLEPFARRIRMTDPGDSTLSGLPAVDSWHVQRWGIDGSRFPPFADIRFKTPTLWEANRRYVVGGAVVIGAQLLLIAALLSERSTRRRAEGTVVAREASLRTSYERIRQLNARMLTAEESARAAIARELHDDVCQELVGVLLALSSLRRTSGDVLGPDVHDRLSRLHDTTSSVVAGVRRMSHELHPSTLRLMGLAAAVRAHCVEVERRHDVQIAFESHGDANRLHPDAALCVFRVVQEALRNAAVHGHSRHIGVAIRLSSNLVDVTVLDDGRGFDVDAARRTSGGLGLIMMEERVRLLGGTMEIISAPQEGAVLVVQIPVDGGTALPVVDFAPLETTA